MVREVGKDEAAKFIRKAEELYYSAMENYQKRRFNASIFDASQSVILANDAFCISGLGRRGSKDHREAIKLHILAAAGKENKREIVSQALEMRGTFGYTERDTDEKEAGHLLVRAKRFLDWVKEKAEAEK